MTNDKLVSALKRANDVSTPLVGISTPDQYATLATAVTAFEASAPLLRWDLARGLVPVNEAGKLALPTMARKANMPTIDADTTGSPVDVLRALAPHMPEQAVLFLMHANRFFADPAYVVALGNLRDAFKLNFRMVVLLGPSFDLPVDLAHDVILLDEPLPSRADLAAIIATQYANSGLSAPSGETVEAAVDAVQGLAAFTAEQVVAMSLTKNGIDLDALWARKREAIERTPGLTVWRGDETFASIGGMDGIKSFLGRTARGKARPQAVVFIDEIEKGLAGAHGAHGDTSGTSQAIHGYLLKYMSDNDVQGVLFVGHPGTSKSMIAKALGNEIGKPTIAFDLSGTKGSLVGESERQMREALRVIDSVSGGRPLFIATSNSVASLSPELMRRFKRTYFFDLPSDAEREAIWTIYLSKYALDPMQPRPDDAGWTGADIANCAYEAWSQDITLVEASGYVTPQIRRSPEAIARLRAEATGRYLDASRGGVYTEPSMPASDPTPAPAAGRKVRLDAFDRH